MDAIGHRKSMSEINRWFVDGDVESRVVDSYMTWVAWMLREIELMTLSGVHLYRLYRFPLLFYLCD